MSEAGSGGKKVLLVMGCPEVPVQNALATFLGNVFRKKGDTVILAGNPSVIQLLRVADPEGHYLKNFANLDKIIAELAEKKRSADITIGFAHNDAGISYIATLRHLLPETRLIAVVFGRNAEELAATIHFPCEKIVEKAVHNPVQIVRKIQEVFGWGA